MMVRILKLKISLGYVDVFQWKKLCYSVTAELIPRGIGISLLAENESKPPISS